MRLYFALYNLELFAEFPLSLVLRTFLTGLRFDIASIFLINGVFILAWFLPLAWQAKRLYQLIFVWGYWLVNSIFIVCNVIDVELYHFTGKRMTFEFANLSDDWGRQAPQLIVYYWQMAIVSALLILLFARSIYRSRWWDKTGKAPFRQSISATTTSPSRTLKKRRPLLWVRSLWILGLLTVYILGCRGGWQLRPLQPIYAFSLENDRLGTLALNSTFTLIHSLHQESLSEIRYFPASEVVRILKNERHRAEPSSSAGTNSASPKTGTGAEVAPSAAMRLPTPTQPINVVIIIMESFGLEYLGDEQHVTYMPFLKELTQQCLFLKNHFANGRRSIEALPSILAGIPALMSEPLMTSRYQTNTVNGLGQILKDHGYSTAFMHGGKNGTMLFDTYSRRMGYQKYYGLNEYPHAQRDFDGNWGIYDEPFFVFSAQEMGRLPKPFHAVLFSLTSHQPYLVPKKYKNKFPRGTLEVHESLGYADFSLRQFFLEAKKQDWYENTLFVITADHTQKSERPEFRDTLGQYRVPLLFCHPGGSLPRVEAERIAQHVDILPSILDYLGYHDERIPLFGASIFSSTARPWAANFSGQSYWFLDQNYFIQLSEGDITPKLFSHRGTYSLRALNEAKEASSGEADLRFLKALIQYYRSGLTHNSWYDFASP